MEENMKVSTIMIKNLDKEIILGQTAENIEVAGYKGSNMASAP